MMSFKCVFFCLYMCVFCINVMSVHDVSGLYFNIVNKPFLEHRLLAHPNETAKSRLCTKNPLLFCVFFMKHPSVLHPATVYLPNKWKQHCDTGKNRKGGAVINLRPKDSRCERRRWMCSCCSLRWRFLCEDKVWLGYHLLVQHYKTET